MRLLIATIAFIALINQAIAVNVTVTANTGVVGKPTKFKICVNGEFVEKTVPLDVILVMDCSGSMDRWGNIITEVKEVELGHRYQKVGEFVLRNTSDVEVMLQTPLDLYAPWDTFKAYIVNENTGKRFPTKSGYSIARWRNVPPGRYSVYAKVNGRSYPVRLFCVELPPERLELAKNAAKMFVDLLGKKDRVGLVEFKSYGNDWIDYTKIVQHLTEDKRAVKSAIDELHALGGTPMGYGLKLAVNELRENGRKDSNKVIVLLTDGWWNMGPDPIRIAKCAKEMGIKIYTVGYGGVDKKTLRDIAKITEGSCSFAANESDLKRIYSEIAKEIRVIGKNATLKVVLRNVSFVGSNPECERSENVLIWKIGDLPRSINFSVTVESERVGRFKVADCWLNYTAPNGSFVSKRFGVFMEFVNHPPEIEVSGNTEVVEGSWLNLKIVVNDVDGHKVHLNYTAPISGIFKRLNDDTWILKWMPSKGFVETGTRSFTIHFTARDEYGAKSEKDVTVVVHDSKKWLRIWPEKSIINVSEGNCTQVRLFVDSSSDYTVNYEVKVKNGTFVAILEPFEGGMIFGFTPLYNFTNDNKTVTVTFEARNLDGLTAKTNISIRVNNVNVTVWPWVKMELLNRCEIYVGEPVYIKAIFVNATYGRISVNGVNIWNSKIKNSNEVEKIAFIPNTAGRFMITAWAINGSIEIPTHLPPMLVSIKEVQGSVY